jgi:hypothetical protein
MSTGNLTNDNLVNVNNEVVANESAPILCVPCFVDRCNPPCTTPSGRTCAMTSYSTFNYHHIHHLFNDEAEIIDILNEIVNSAVLMCPHKECATKIRGLAQTFTTAKAKLLHYTQKRGHLTNDDQIRIYLYIDKNYPLRAPVARDIPDNISVHSGYSNFSQMSMASRGSMNSQPSVQKAMRRVQLSTVAEQPLPLLNILAYPANAIMSEEDFLKEFPDRSLVDYFRYEQREKARNQAKQSSGSTAMITDKI